VEWRLTGETEVLGENLTQRHFVHHKSHMTRPGFEPGPTRWDASDQPQMIDDGDCGETGEMKIGRGNRSTRERTCPSATLSTTNPTTLTVIRFKSSCRERELQSLLYCKISPITWTVVLKLIVNFLDLATTCTSPLFSSSCWKKLNTFKIKTLASVCKMLILKHFIFTELYIRLRKRKLIVLILKSGNIKVKLSL
jgi:hypothetical protein